MQDCKQRDEKIFSDFCVTCGSYINLTREKTSCLTFPTFWVSIWLNYDATFHNFHLIYSGGQRPTIMKCKEEKNCYLDDLKTNLYKLDSWKIYDLYLFIFILDYSQNVNEILATSLQLSVLHVHKDEIKFKSLYTSHLL